jgi:hypothetical protein
VGVNHRKLKQEPLSKDEDSEDADDIDDDDERKAVSLKLNSFANFPAA